MWGVALITVSKSKPISHFFVLYRIMQYLLVNHMQSEGESCSVMSDSLWLHGLCSPWNSLGQNTGVISLSFLQAIFPTQGSNPGLPYWRWILYQLSHNVSPRILVWVAYPFSMDLPNPGIEPGSPALQADCLPTELSGKPIICKSGLLILPNL